MANFVDLSQGGPDAVRALGALVRTAGDKLTPRAQAILARIQEIEATAPWGDDDYGHEFLSNYHEKMDGKPANELLKSWLQENGAALTQLGNALIAAMDGYDEADATSLIDMEKVQLDTVKRE